MFARRLNELSIDLIITPVSPLLVKEETKDDAAGDAQQQTVNAVAKKMVWVETKTAGGASRRYVPGSSLRGVMRAGAIDLIGRWRPDLTELDDPASEAAKQRAEAAPAQDPPPSGADIYSRAGPVERCFGHPALRGRWTMSDALWSEPTGSLHTRHGVGISRTTGAAQDGVKYQFETITTGSFTTTLTLVNYELWQLGVLAHLLAQLDGGEIRLGYGQRRGFGRVRVSLARNTFRWYDKETPKLVAGGVIPSLGRLAADAKLPGDYGCRDTDQTLELTLKHLTTTPFGSDWSLAMPQTTKPGGVTEMDWTAPPWPAFAALLRETMDQWPEPEAAAAGAETETAA